MKLLKTLALGTAFALSLAAGSASAEDIRIGLVVKSLGNGFFDAANKGALEAAKEIGGVQIIYTGPTTTTAEGQIEVINSLIAQKVNAIAISANDPDAVVPALKKAMDRGITVISWDSGVAEAGRQLHLNPSSNELIGKQLVNLTTAVLPEGKGDVAILSATSTSTNQNIWIEEFKKAQAAAPGINLVTVAYGDDLSDKSYREAVSILKNSPNVKVIVAPTTVGILAAAQAVEDQGLVGKVYVTGLGLPSELAGHVKAGSIKSFAIWNPIDLGYSATYLAYDLASGKYKAEPGVELPIGRVGKVKLGDDLQGAMSDPFVYDASNVDEFAKIF
ncbi:rhamnose ABC transporter substrate-binding protein [Kaistia dalseonensis]|uniref:Rhamnose transport system substrate-binding protein n=1 Tax=Kaistia dalseonensis TaxID=410840 RepID=A0ABU0H678_9HYPH|nr:rhamnose ABC transporter substrate-binding protein [Kaistia dalseonensis]MCX5495226.1 rhamnose ABC transporter substrate-binding protein [Kaistia dalseonensis]MDQ0437812.1 rhamnose transport system substrate-binding protein [Kaistia dalseonensis]